jgi:hypothetical protein
LPDPDFFLPPLEFFLVEEALLLARARGALGAPPERDGVRAPPLVDARPEEEVVRLCVRPRGLEREDLAMVEMR